MLRTYSYLYTRKNMLVGTRSDEWTFKNVHEYDFIVDRLFFNRTFSFDLRLRKKRLDTRT